MQDEPYSNFDEGVTLEALYEEVAAVKLSHCDELSYERDNGEFLVALVSNNNRAWLMYLREEGDSGFRTRDPNYSGSMDTQYSYYLSNGQRDEYPAWYTVPLDSALKAIQYFLKHGGMAPWLTWHDDSVNDKE